MKKNSRRQLEIIPSGYNVKRAMKFLIFTKTIDHFLRNNQCKWRENCSSGTIFSSIFQSIRFDAL